MSSQTTSSSQIISLPKSGDARKGLGEKFSPDLHTRTGNFSVPLALSPVRNGFQPQLNLAYSTSNGNGYFGLGWSLSIPGVMRKTSKGIPRYRDDDREVANWDTFVLSGAEDLVPVEDPSCDPPKATRSRCAPMGSLPRASITMIPKLESPIGHCQQNWADQYKSVIMPAPVNRTYMATERREFAQ